eukprot:gene26837-29758_t
MADQADERLQSLRSEVDTLKAEKANQKMQHDAQLAGLEKKMVTVTRTMHDRGKQVKQLNEELKAKDDELAKQRAELQQSTAASST